MYTKRTFVLLCAVALVVGSSALAAAAGNSMQVAATPEPLSPTMPHVPASQLIQVKTCDPKLNVGQTGGYVGYAPGFYYYRGGFWPNVYGTTIYQPPVTTTNPQLGIDYVNVAKQPMTSIEFGLIANGNLVAEVKDVGTFSPGVEIKHKFGLSPNVFPLQTGLPQCVPLKIVFADGQHWRSLRLPRPNPQGNPAP